MNVSIEMVVAGTRLRGANPDTVAALAASIADVGLLHPVTVYARDIIQAGISVPGWGVVAGLHRMEACKRLGHTEIAVHVVSLGDLERQIAECDENLCGTKLTPAERAMFTRRRKEAYEALHPETRNGAKGNGREELSQLEKATFSEDTAAKTGQGRSTIARDAARGSRIDDDVLADIQGTDLDKGTVLDDLAATPRDEQAGKVAELRRRVEDRKLVQSAGDDIVQRDAADDIAQMIIDFFPEHRMTEAMSYLDACGATRVSKAVRRALKTGDRIGSDRPVFDQSGFGTA
jgi:ParB-like chromosome segregation protein Spo0J